MRTHIHLLTACFLGLTLQTSHAASLSVTPNSVGDDYRGVITLQIGGLNSGETVYVEQFTDVDGDGTPESQDVTMQAFPLTDGEAVVFGGITNLHVPGDLNGTAGSITAQLHMQAIGFEQRAIGKKVYRLSSPTSRFTAVNVPFTITNAAYASRISGAIKCLGTNVPYASVMLFKASGEGIEPSMLGAADSSGNYSLRVPPGEYMAAAFKSNYLTSFATAPAVSVGSGTNLSTNLTVIAAARKISGRVTDYYDNAHGLGGLLVTAEANDGKLAIGFSDKNGNFSIGVTPDVWEYGVDDVSLSFLGYLAGGNRPTANTTSGNVTGVNLPATEAEGLFYGTITSEAGVALAGLALYGDDDQQGLWISPRTDENGQYFAPNRAGNWQLDIATENNPDYPGMIFSRGLQNVSVIKGGAIRQDFTGKTAPYLISGYVRSSSGAPLEGICVWGGTSMGGKEYQSQGDTDETGFYSMPAANGVWSVVPSCDGDVGLRSRGYACTAELPTTVANGNATATFTVTLCEGTRIMTGSLPSGRVNENYNGTLQAESCEGNINWNLTLFSGPLPPGLVLFGNGIINGMPQQAGTWNFTVEARTGTDFDVKNFSITIEGGAIPLDIDNTSLTSATAGSNYTCQLVGYGGQPPYTWSLTPGSAPLPPGITLGSSSGLLSGTPTTSGQFSFRVRLTDAAQATDDQVLSLWVMAPVTPLNITTTVLPAGTLGVFYSQAIQATGGTAPIWWSLASGSAQLPTGLWLNGSGIVEGSPTTSGTFYFITQVYDSGTPIASDEQLVSLTINPGQSTPPSLTAPVMSADGKFCFSVNGIPGQNYQLQLSIDLASWTTVATTNAVLGTFMFEAPSASAERGYYRVMVGP